jgi:hypothetical protein
MAGDVVNFKVCSPLKMRSGLTRKKSEICHYSYNLPLLRHDVALYNCFTENSFPDKTYCSSNSILPGQRMYSAAIIG